MSKRIVKADLSEIGNVSKYFKLKISYLDLQAVAGPGQVDFIGGANNLPAGAIIKSVSLRVKTLFTGGRTTAYNFAASIGAGQVVASTDVSDITGTLPLNFHLIQNDLGDINGGDLVVSYTFNSPSAVDEIANLTAGELELLIEYFDALALTVSGSVTLGF